MKKFLVVLFAALLFLLSYLALPAEIVSDAEYNVQVAEETIGIQETTEYTTPSAVEVPEGSSLEVHFIDVGQADCSLILCDGEAALIDGGNTGDDETVVAYLEEIGVEELQIVMATHGHEDHCGGLGGILQKIPVQTAYCSVISYDSNAFRNFLDRLDEQGVALTVPSVGDSFSVGAATATILGPISPSNEPNNTSIVFRLDYGDTSFLFTGDAEYEEETEILEAGYDISCDVLKTGHHGSETSTGYRWLRETDPVYAVISCGMNNSYGHPHEDTLSRFRDAEVKVYRTDLQGSVVCTSDGKTVSFSTEKSAESDT